MLTIRISSNDLLITTMFCAYNDIIALWHLWCVITTFRYVLNRSNLWHLRKVVTANLSPKMLRYTHPLRLQDSYVNTRLVASFLSRFTKMHENTRLSMENACFGTYLRMVCQKIKNPSQIGDFWWKKLKQVLYFYTGLVILIDGYTIFLTYKKNQ